MSKRTIIKWFLMVIFAVTINSPLITHHYLFASFEDDATGARAKGLGGAYVSVADGSETVFIQPAGALNLKTPEASVSYGRLYVGLSDGSDINDGMLSCVFPIKGKFAAGIGYKSAGLRQVYTEQTIILNGSTYVARKLIGGLSLKLLNVTYGTDRYTERDPVFDAGYGKSGLDADLGYYYRFNDNISAGLSVLNILHADLGLQSSSPAAQKNRVGVSYRETGYMMTAEAVNAGGRNKYIAAFEKSLFAGLIPVRMGFGWGDNLYRKISTGFGVNVDRFRMDYSWEYPLSGIEQTSGTHYLSFSARFFPPKGTAKKPEEIKPVKAEEPVKKPEEMPRWSGEKKEKADIQKPISPVLLPGMLTPLQAPVSGFITAVSTAAEQPAVEISTKTVPAVVELSTPTVTVSTAAAESGIIFSTKPATIYFEKPKEKPASSAGGPAKTLPAGKPEYVPVILPGVGPVIVPQAQKPESMPASRKPGYGSGLRTHRVISGDSLVSLAEKYYGTRDRWTTIYQANKDKIEKGALKPGQTIIIP